MSGWHVEVVRLLLSFFSYSSPCLDSTLWDAADFRSDLLSHPRAECTGLDYANQQLLISCLVEAGADPNNSASRQGNIVIDTATWIDLVGALKALLENGANANSRGAAGETALHHLGSPVHVKKGPWRYLHETGIRLLLQHGASVMIQDDSGNTPLHYAAFGSNMHIFSIYTTGLPTDSSDSNALNSVRNSSGETLLHWAAAGKKIGIVRFLLSSDADVNAANEKGWTPLMCALAPSTANEAVRSCSYTTLQAVRSILGHGANPLTCIAEGWTPLHCLSLYLDHSGSNDDLASLAERFISNGVPANSRATMLTAVTTSGRKSLRVSSREVGIWGSRVLEHLQSKSEDPRATVKDSTPLHWAVFYGAVGMTVVLLANGADVNALDANGNVPGDLIDSSPLLQKRPEIRANLTCIWSTATNSSANQLTNAHKRNGGPCR